MSRLVFIAALAALGLTVTIAGGWLEAEVTEAGSGDYPALVNQNAVFDGDFAVLKSIEQLAFSDRWGRDAELVVPLGGHAMIIVAAGPHNTCLPVNFPDADARVFVLLPTNLTSPSSRKAPIGTYYDILAPFNSVTCRLSPFRLLEWKPKRSGLLRVTLGENSVSVTVVLAGGFSKPSKPFMVGLSNIFLMKGHCKSYCAIESELGQLYGKLLVDHHATPIQSWIHFPPISNQLVDLDHRQEQSQSFRQNVFGGFDGYINFPRMTHFQRPRLYLEALERTVRLEGLSGRAWVYVRDEPKNIASLKKELEMYRDLAPSVLTMVTTKYRPELASLVDIFAPNIADWNPSLKGHDSRIVWPYVSCMGSCGPNRAILEDTSRNPGPEVHRPDFLIDRPASRIDEYFALLSQARAGGGLYYHAVEGHALYRKGIDVLEDPWNFGGNGDGVLIYPGRPGELGLRTHQALPSFRLKLIRQSIERHWRS